LIVADDTADARLIAFDLVSQAEHDEAAASVLVTHSETIANAVLNALEAVVEGTEHRQRVKVALSGQQSAVVLVDDLSAALRFANFDATEHLELHTKDPLADAARISNAGAIFLGSNSPVSLGDYIAGSNHVLPTGGQAKFGAGLGVHSFLRAQQLIDYTRSGLQEIAGLVRDFADAEGLPAHGDAIVARFE
jgi:histidinol dehydrogenase